MSSPAKAALLGAAAIVALGVSIYASSLSYPFVYDDAPSITQNPGIRWTPGDAGSWDRLRFWQPTRRPVANASFALNYAWGGLDVRGYRAVNIAVHVLASLGVAVLSWLAIGALGRRSAEAPSSSAEPLSAEARAGLAVLAGLLFVAHPLATQSVTYVVQRMTSLSTLFYVAALCVWISGNRGGARSRGVYRGAALVLWLLAMGSKEIAATGPLAVWLWEWQVERSGTAARAFARRSVPWAVGFAAAGVGVLWAYSGGDPLGGYSRKPFTLGERLWTEPRVWWSYVGLALAPLPSRLSLIHDVEMSRGLFTPWTTALAIGAWLAAAVVTLRVWGRSAAGTAFGAVVVWWLLQQAVEGTFLPLEPVYEHRTYLPLVALCALGPWGVWSALGVARSRLAIAVAAGLVAALTVATAMRNPVWRSAESLWRDALHKAPGHPRPHTNLGMALATQGRNEDALVYYRQAAALEPDFQEAHHNAGVALHVLGRLEEAKLSLERALELEPKDRHTHWTLGQVRIGLGDFDAGVDQIEKGAQLGAEAALLLDLGRYRAAQGRLEEAERWLGYAVAMDRTNALMHASLGAVLVERGDLVRACGHLGLALKEREDPVVRALLARAQWARGAWAEALASAERAAQSSPERLEVAATLAWMLATSPEPDARDPQRALRLLRPHMESVQSAQSAESVDPFEPGASLGAEVDPRLLEAAGVAFAVSGSAARADALLAAGLGRARSLGLLGVASSIENELARVRNGASLIETSATAAARIHSGSWSPERPNRGSTGSVVAPRD